MNKSTDMRLETQERPIWQIQILKQNKVVCCYYCDTKIIKTLKYYGKPIKYKLENGSIMLTEGEKLILEFLDRSNLEFERGWLLRLGYGDVKKEEGMCVLKKSEDESKIKEKYNIDPPVSISEVPKFSIKCNMFISKNDSYIDFKNKLHDCLPNYRENYKEFLECIKGIKKINAKGINELNAKGKGIMHEEITINKDDIPVDTEDSDRGIRRTYKYICPENSIIIINSKDINEGIDGIYIQ